MTRKLTIRQSLIKQVAQTIYDSEYKLDFSDIRRLCDEFGKDNEYWNSALASQRKRVRAEIKKELDMAYCAIERGGKMLVEINQEGQKPLNENIGKRVFVEATYDPATSKSHPETFGTIESVDDTGYLFQVRRDSDNSLSWHDSRTIKVLPHATETQAKGGLLAKYERKQAGGILDIASAAMYEYDEYKKSVIALIEQHINRQEKEASYPGRGKSAQTFFVGRSQALQDLLKDVKALVEENDQP